MKNPINEIDFESFDNIFANKPEMYLKFIDACISSFKRTAEGIKDTSIYNADFDTISELRHAILPTVASLSLGSTSELLKNIYPGNKEIKTVVTNLEENIESVITILEAKRKEIVNS